MAIRRTRAEARNRQAEHSHPRHRQRRAAGLAAGAAVALTMTACGSSGGPAGRPVAGGSSGGSLAKGAQITFMDITTLSGPSAFIGQFGTSAAYPAVNEINAAGGVLGHKVKLALVDDKNDPADAVPAVERAFATSSNVAVVLGPLTTVGPTLVPIINARKTTMMSVAGEDEFNRPTQFRYFWRYFPPDSANGVAMALWAQQHGWTRVATVFTSDAGAQGDLPGVVAGVKALHLKLVNQTTLVAGQPSYQSEVAHLLSLKPQAIFTETDPTTAATFYGELATLGKNIPVVGSQTTVVPTWLQVVAKAVGLQKFASEYYGVNQSSPAATPAGQVFNRWLLASSSKVPKPKQWIGNPFVEANYDAVIVPALAMDAAHSTDPARYNSFIPQVTNGGPGAVKVYSYAQGARLLAQGKKIQYIGAHGPMNFNQFHNSFGGYVIDSYSAAGKMVPRSSISQAQIQHYVPNK